MPNGIFQTIDERTVRLSENPDALNPRSISLAVRTAAAEFDVTPEDAKACAEWMQYAREIAMAAGVDLLALGVMSAVENGLKVYAERGGPRYTVLPAQDTDELEQQTF
jgi:hypothetical protein